MVDPVALSNAMFPDPVRIDLRIGARIEGVVAARLITFSKVASTTVSTSESSVLDKTDK